MKCLLDFTIYTGGGSSTYAHGFLQELALRTPPGDGCVVLLPETCGVLAQEESALRDVGYIVRRPTTGPGATWRAWIARQAVVPLLAIRYRATVVFTPRETSALLTPSRLVVLARNLAVWQIDGSSGSRTNGRWLIRHLLGRLSIARASLVLVTSETMASSVRAKENKTKVVHHGCDLPLNETKRASYGSIRVTAIGTISKHKRYDVVIHAVRELSDRGIDVDFSLWGDTANKQETARLRSLSVAVLGYDALRGVLPGDRRAAVFAESDILALGSSYESFCFPMVEAMRTGTVVWAPESALVRELCQRACVVYREGDYADAAQQLIKALPVSERLRAEGWRRSEHFSWKQCVDSTIKALFEACGTTPTSGP